MADGNFTSSGLTLSYVDKTDIPLIQDILNHAPYYHSAVIRHSPDGLAARCFEAPPPEVKNSRVFKRFFKVSDAVSNSPVCALDVFVGYPNYKIASVAMCVIREDMQRKGIGTRLLTGALPAFLQEFHPAVQTLSISLTDNNVPALRFLVKNNFSRTARWEKLDVEGRPIIALTYQAPVRCE